MTSLNISANNIGQLVKVLEVGWAAIPSSDTYMEGQAIEANYKQGEKWKVMGEPQDATLLSSQRAGGFVGTTIGPHARK